jgi:hypothetical protein
VARPQGRWPAVNFYPCGHPTPYAYGLILKFVWVWVGVVGCGWPWMGVNGFGWVWVSVGSEGVDGYGWVWVGMGRRGWVLKSLLLRKLLRE